MNVQDLFYHGVIEQIRRVCTALGPERLEKGLSAFEDGASNWSQCFFARALAGERLHDEHDVCRILGFYQARVGPKGERYTNPIPVRIIYRTFDSAGTTLTKVQLYKILSDIMDESRPSEVMDFLRTVNYAGAETTPANFSTACA